jgi:hypothetical protein
MTRNIGLTRFRRQSRPNEAIANFPLATLAHLESHVSLLLLNFASEFDKCRL